MRLLPTLIHGDEDSSSREAAQSFSDDVWAHSPTAFLTVAVALTVFCASRLLVQLALRVLRAAWAALRRACRGATVSGETLVQETNATQSARNDRVGPVHAADTMRIGLSAQASPDRDAGWIVARKLNDRGRGPFPQEDVNT